MEGYKNTWVWIETFDGAARSVGLELLTPGRQMADTKDESLVAVVLGYKSEKAVQSAAAYGADQVIWVDDIAFEHYNVETYTAAMCQLVEKYKPDTVLF